MSIPRDGGSAFPFSGMPDVIETAEGYQDTEKYSQGMSLRDFFAAQALIALMSNSRWVNGLDEALEAGKFKAGLSQHAYMLADAMLAERAK